MTKQNSKLDNKREQLEYDLPFKNYLYLFFSSTLIILALAIIIVPVWWIINRFIPSIKYWYIFLFMICNVLFIEAYEWLKDYKKYKRLNIPYNPWLIMLIFTLSNLIIISICYFVITK